MPTEEQARKARAKKRLAERKPPTKPLTRNELETTISNYDETFLECRDLRHPWAVVGYFRNGAGITRIMQCRRCPTKRFQTVSARGEILSNRYEYPDGYQISGTGAGGVPNAEIRRVVFSRVSIFNSEHDMMATLVESGGRRTAGRKSA